MTEQIPIGEARNSLTGMPEMLQKNSESSAIAITRRGKPVLAVMSWDLYESLMETLEVLTDKDLMVSLAKGIKEVKAGKTVPWNNAKAKLEQ